MRIIYFFVLFLAFTATEAFTDGVKKYYISCDPAQLKQIYDNPLDDIYIPISLEFEGKTWTDVEMRIRGDGSRLDPKKSLKLNFKGEVFSNGREKINFNAEYLDLTYASSYLSAHVYREVGIPVFDIEHAALYINNEFFGLYLRIENVDEQYLTARDMNPKGNLYKATYDGASLSRDDDCKLNWEKKTNENGIFDDLYALRDSVNAIPSKDFKPFLLRTFDYQNLIDIIAINILISNASTYYHNYYLYHDINGSGKWIYMPWDMDKTFSHQGYGKDYSYTSHPIRQDNPLIEKCFINDEVFADVKERVQQISNSTMNDIKLSPILDSLKLVLTDYVLMDDTDQISGMEAWEQSMGNFKTYFKERIDFLNNMFNKEPQPFEVYTCPQNIYDEYTVKWEASSSSEGEVEYKILLNTNKNIIDGNAQVIENIKETSYTFKNLSHGQKYYFMVVAVAGGTEREGADNHNYFTFYKTKALPCEINENTVLTKEDGPYSVECNTVVMPNINLTIEAGTIIAFDSGMRLKIRGDMQIHGTEDEPVIFEPKRDYERFQDIYFHYTTKPCVLEYFKVLNGGMYSQNSMIDIKGMFMRYDFIDNFEEIPLIWFDFTGGKLEKSTIISNGQREGFIYKRHNNIDVHYNTMHNTPDAIEFILCNDIRVSHNAVYNSTDDAVDLNGCSNADISYNYFYNSADKGISVGNDTIVSEKINIHHNVFEKCKYGVEVKASSLEAFNNTFIGNETAIHSFERRAGDGGGNATTYNNLFFNNNKDLVVDDKSTASLNYSLSNKELHQGIGNLQADPMFVDAAFGNYYLMPNSPAIDAGDPNSPKDEDGSRADMGAFPFEQHTTNIVINEIHYNQDDIVISGDWVELYNNSGLDIDLSNWYFSDSDDAHKFVIPNGTILQKNAYLVLAETAKDFSSSYPGVKNYIGSLDFGFSGSGELLRLFNPYGVLIDHVEYSDKAPWPTEADGDGYTLSLIDSGYDNALPESWLPSKEKYGTPGKSNFGTDLIDIHKTDVSFKVYPMPANSYLNVVFNKNFDLGSVLIYDTYGNSVLAQKTLRKSGEMQIDVSGFAPGTYYLMVNLSDGSSVNSKFVVIR